MVLSRRLAVKRGLAVMALAAVCLAAAGCWDRMEIQDRAFVLAVAIDVPEAGVDKEPGRARMESYTSLGPPPRYRVTFQVLKISGGKAGEEKPGGESKAYLLSSTGPGIFEALRDALGESSKAVWFENIQAIVVSEAVMKRYGMAAPLDLFRRDGEMRWRAQVFITPGEARKILEIQPPTGEPGGIYLARVARRQAKDIHLASARTDMSFAIEAIDWGEDIMFPVLEPVGQSIKIKGAAMFKGREFLGYMDEYTVKGLRLIRGTEKSALITFECPVHPGSAVTFELFRHQTSIKPVVEGDKVSFELSIGMRGNIGEIQCEYLHNSQSKEYQLRAQELFAEEVKRNIEHTLAFCQARGWETFYMRRSLEAYKPADWERLKDRWSEIYPTVPVRVTVKVSIVNVGEHK